MKLFFDARYIRPDFHDGISRYSTELGKALAKLTKVTFIISDRGQLRHLPKNADYVQIHAPTSPLEPLTSLVLNQYEPDVVFSPMQTMGTLGRQFKLVLTTHDLIYYRHRTPPQNLPALIRLGWRFYHFSFLPQRLALNGADAVATVSHTTLRQIRKENLTKRPIVVVPNAPQELKRYVHKVDTSKPPRDLIYMGSFMPYKNVETLLAAMAFLPEYKLHLLSRIAPKRRAELKALIPEHANVEFHNGTSDEEYARLLADNGILVTASLDEGYGLPIAEALALGVPVVVSDIPIFHEVANSGGLYFEPKNPEDFAAQVRKLDDNQLRQRLSKQGKAHIESFDWAASARALLTTLETLTSDRIDNHGRTKKAQKAKKAAN